MNAVAALVSKYLPAFAPHLSYYEERCYVEKEDGRIVLVVSPDGSLRCNGNEKLIYGIEINCPFPGKTLTTPVHYGIPHYYVCQVQSEMHSLGVDKLLFLSYSKESMTVHEITYDAVLWEKIYELIKNVDYKHIPKRLNVSIPSIKDEIKEFCQSKVRLHAELSSCTADYCDHPMSSDEARIYHPDCIKPTRCNPLLREVLRVFLKCEDIINDCYKICTTRTSEVLVFLVADLDINYKAEMSHACPISFAFKGYSMKTEQMRKMLQDVLFRLFCSGIYCPVISYDGQRAILALQDDQGRY